MVSWMVDGGSARMHQVERLQLAQQRLHQRELLVGGYALQVVDEQRLALLPPHSSEQPQYEITLLFLGEVARRLDQDAQALVLLLTGGFAGLAIQHPPLSLKPGHLGELDGG